jgi:hypothetical protein
MGLLNHSNRYRPKEQFSFVNNDPSVRLEKRGGRNHLNQSLTLSTNAGLFSNREKPPLVMKSIIMSPLARFKLEERGRNITLDMISQESGHETYKTKKMENKNEEEVRFELNSTENSPGLKTQF